uniref:hypothetical protein n=1 Tax=Actinacidiphila rubida TaxID=310780 RepID=UPI000849A7B7
MTDKVTEDYLRRTRDPHAALGHAMDRITWPPALAAAAGHRLLPRPLFLAAQHLDRAAHDVVQLFGLLTALPDLLFDGDLNRYCAAVGIDARKQRLITSLGGTAPPLYGRADLSYDGQRFQLLEFNVGSEIGGVDRAGTIPRLLARADAFRPFAAAHHLAHLDTDRLVAGALRTAAATVTAQAAPTVALLEAPGGLGRFGPVWQALAELMRGHGIDFLVGEVQHTRRRHGRLTLDGRRLDVVLRCFSAEEILAHPDGEDLVADVLDAHREGTCVLFTPLESALFHNKAALALLSDPRARAALPAAQQDLVDRFLPWTRTLPADPGADRALLEQCMDLREELILKPSAQYGGNGVVAGRRPPRCRR